MEKISEVTRLFKNKIGLNQTVKTGFSELDKLLKLYPQGGQLIVLASRPAIAKSALALNIANSFASLNNSTEAIGVLTIAQYNELKIKKLKDERDRNTGVVISR